MQSKKDSFLEAAVQSILGLLISLAVSPLVYWLSDLEVTPTQIGKTTLLFYLIGFVRSYVIRRLFTRTDRSLTIKVVESDRHQDTISK